MSRLKRIKIAVFLILTFVALPENVWGSWRDEETKPAKGTILWNHEGTSLYSVHIEHNNPKTGKTHRVHVGATLPIETKENNYFKKKGEKADICLFFDRTQLKGREVVCLMPGRAGHMGEKWVQETTHDLAIRNYVVFVMDPMGQGHSSGNKNRCLSHPKLKCCPRKGHIDGFEDYMVGMKWFLTNVRAAAGQKVVLLPHSLSGAVYLRFRMDCPNIDNECVKAVYPLAPMIQFKTPPFPLWFSEFVVSWMCWLGYGKYYALGRGPEMDAVNHAFKEMHVGGPTYDWVNKSFKWTRELRDESSPEHFKGRDICLIIPGDDRTVCPLASNAFAHKNGIRVLNYPKFWHDALKEKVEWRTTILDFIEADMIKIRWKRLRDLKKQIRLMQGMMSFTIAYVVWGETFQKLAAEYQTELRIARKMNSHYYRKKFPLIFEQRRYFAIFSKKDWPQEKLTWKHH